MLIHVYTLNFPVTSVLMCLTLVVANYVVKSHCCCSKPRSLEITFSIVINVSCWDLYMRTFLRAVYFSVLIGIGLLQSVQYPKWSPTANDPETAIDPQNGPQVIPKVDRKWSRKKNMNGLDLSLRIIVSILLLLLQKVSLKARFCFPNNYINKN